MTQDRIRNEYFNWLFNLVCGRRYSKNISFKKLLMHLHNREFIYLIPKDQNRAEDGKDLRWRFVCDNRYPDYDDAVIYLDGPCSVLEMMVALAIRCEETIMDDPNIGDRTAQWFWNMVVSLGLGSMLDGRYDKKFVDETIDIFLNREYEPNGKGGLFTVRGCDGDLRNIEIWYQMCWYLDNLV